MSKDPGLYWLASFHYRELYLGSLVTVLGRFSSGLSPFHCASGRNGSLASLSLIASQEDAMR